MKLVITEKPSVAQSIAKVIGATTHKDGYLEGNNYIVSWCVGHLIELSGPESYDEKYEKWKYSDLPIIPNQWKYQVATSTKKQFQILKGLMERPDVEGLIEATDAGREGELIFRLVYNQTKCAKPFERLWISSMEDKVIVDGFANLKDGIEYDALYQAALSREHADWIVGMNATRLFSTLYGQTLNVGRVMTPTLTMLVTREAEISGFKSEPFYSVAFQIGGVVATSEKMIEKIKAEELRQKVAEEKAAIVTKIEVLEKKESPPMLYDLTNLQRDANRILGFTAQQTLDYTQSLYEKKLVTYPRTDSRFLTADMEASISKLVDQMADKFGFTKYVSINSNQVINSKKVTDHHGIIPTLNVTDVNFGALPSGEQKVLSLIVARLISAVGESCVKQETKLEFKCANHLFEAKRNIVLGKGWREIEEWILGNKAERNDMEEQSPIVDGLFEPNKTLHLQKVEIKEGNTTPKKHFTEDTLLSAMEHASADDMPENAEHQGIGTPATRAGTIEKLVRIGFVERKGDKKTKYLMPTHKGTALITVMPEQINSPIMTAEWEQKLLEIEHRNYESSAFLDEISIMITNLIANYKVIEEVEVLMKPVANPVGICPCCGKYVVEKTKGFFCENKECRFALWKENHFLDSLSKKMTKAIAESLLRDRKVSLKKCRSIKTGKSFDTTLVMAVDENQKVQFSLEFEKRNKGKER